MTVAQVIDTLKLEKQQRVPSRFPCRAIMVGNIAEYCDLLEKLKTIPNVEVTTEMRILCDGSVFEISSVEDVKGRGMYVEVLAKEVEPSG